MKSINMVILMVIIMVSTILGAVSFGAGVVYADRYAIKGLGGKSTESVMVSVLAMRFTHNHAQANAILSAAAKDKQYGMTGLFDLAHHAY